MHSQETVARVLALRAEGLGARRIAKQTALPVATVGDWLAGRLPRYAGNDQDSRDDAWCDQCGNPPHHFPELPAAYPHLLGLYLGDGCISRHARGVYRLRIILDTKYPGIIAFTASTLEEIRSGPVHVQTRPCNCVEVSAYWKSWPCLFPQAGPGKKHARTIALTDWQLDLVTRWPEQLLRGLIESDGSRFTNTGRGGWVWPRYNFRQTSDDIRAIFCQACDLLGVQWTFSAPHTIYVSRKADVARLDEFIGPKT